MACIVNMDDVFKLVQTTTASRQLNMQAQDWLARRLPAEAARREDWTTPTARATGLDEQVPASVAAACRQHIERAISKGEPLVRFTPASAEDEMRTVADWLASLPTEEPDLLRKLPKVTWAQAVDHSRRWHERLAKQNAEAVTAAELAEGTKVVLGLANGWHWIRLTTEAALDRESQAMGHCVGSGGYDRLLKAKAPNGIYSLRDNRGRPHVTVEVRKGTVDQAQGKGNAEPTGHADRMAVLARALDVDIGSVAPGLFGMARIDGRLMSIDQALERLGGGRVNGDVDLTGCTSLTHLPDGLTVGGELFLRDCTSLTYLPDRMTVGGGLNLTGCTSLTHLPDGMTVGGWLGLTGCTSLTHLPNGMTVGDGLSLYGCTSLTHLPDGLMVGGGLFLGGCTSLTHLPDRMTVGDGLSLTGCTSLTHLPDGMTVGGALGLTDCTSLTHLPDGLTVSGALGLSGCTSLTHLPDELTIGGWLNLSGCTSLTHLPDELTVGDWLDLSGCTSLTLLPDRLTVGGTLDLRGCTSLTSLPENLSVAGSIYGAEHLPRVGRSMAMAV